MATKKVEEVKNEAAEVKEEVKKSEPKKTAAKKTTAAKKSAPAKKAPAAKKTTASKKAADKKITTVVEFGNKQVEVDAVAEACRADFKANQKGNIRTINVYIKPEDNAAYYVINGGKYSGKIDL